MSETSITISKASFKPYLALAGGIICLGFSGIFVSWANAPGTVTGFYRMGIAAVILAIPFFVRRRQSINLPPKGIAVAIFGGLLFACDLYFFNTGVLLSGAVNPTLMGNTAPLWVAIGALIIFREKLHKPFWAGLGLAMAGAAFILGLDTLRDFSLGLGTFFGLLAGMFYGGYYLVTQLGRRSIDALSYFWIAVASAAIILLVVSLVAGQPLFGYSRRTYLSFLGLGLVSQLLGQFSFSYSLGFLPASFVSPAGLGQPVVTALLVGPLLGQHLSLMQIIGGLAVLLGVFFVHHSRQKADPVSNSTRGG
jgi:drug/metabolite transporter (DMT)-like permease